jgi:hypothetical protein
MKFIEIEQIIIEPVGKNQVKIIKEKKLINVDMICSLGKIAIPSEIAGANGQPQRKEGTKIGLLGEGILMVDMLVEDIKMLIQPQQ